MHLFKKNTSVNKPIILSIIVFVCIFMFFIFAISNTKDEIGANEKDNLIQAIDNAVVSCYATTGAYPESIDEIIEKYGIIIDNEKFIVQYDVISSNVKPNVTIFVKEK